MSGAVSPLARTLDLELLALSRGASLECPVCGEFILHLKGALESTGTQLDFSVQAG